jgi:hypothetical protein
MSRPERAPQKTVGTSGSADTGSVHLCVRKRQSREGGTHNQRNALGRKGAAIGSHADHRQRDHDESEKGHDASQWPDAFAKSVQKRCNTWQAMQQIDKSKQSERESRDKNVRHSIAHHMTEYLWSWTKPHQYLVCLLEQTYRKEVNAVQDVTQVCERTANDPRHEHSQNQLEPEMNTSEGDHERLQRRGSLANVARTGTRSLE